MRFYLNFALKILCCNFKRDFNEETKIVWKETSFSNGSSAIVLKIHFDWLFRSEIWLAGSFTILIAYLGYFVSCLCHSWLNKHFVLYLNDELPFATVTSGGWEIV